jgi:hypothetical protein
MENIVNNKSMNSSDDFDRQAYIYMVLPFQIVLSKKEKLFDDILIEEYSQENIFKNAKALEEKIRPLSIDSSTLPGDHGKYYEFMRYHYGGINDTKGISVFQFNTVLLKPKAGYEAFKNLNAQFGSGAMLGSSSIRMEKLDSLSIVINSIASIGFFVFGLRCIAFSSNPILEELAQTQFFRNIGWRRNQRLSIGQIQQHSFVFNSETKASMTLHDVLECYMHDLSGFISFYQDRATVLYCTNSMLAGNKSDVDLCEISYEIIRIPDRNSGRFEQSVSEPSIHRIGRNVVFTALNEGALVIESANANGSCKNIANKFFPAFFFALNQREVLLGTMQQIAMLDSDKLVRLDSGIFEKMDHMRNGLLVLQLKQIFYSVSNHHEVEMFFNKLQNVFAVEKMLMENEQCVREMFNLIEVRRNDEIERLEKENATLEEKRSKLINTILGAIGCLGLFSFMKDLLPFIQDTQYLILYKFLSIVLPLAVMVWLVWYMADKKSKD